MSGTIPLSLTQQLNEFGVPLNGGKLYIIQAGTVNTPQDSFQDAGLTPALKLPNPITMDAAGRLPQFFLADGFIKIRMTDAAGVVQREADGIQVIGPSSGGGGGGGAAVDPNALIQTGNMIARYGIGALPGYVRCNGLTMGNATSGATERANPDTQPLWLYLYGVDSTLTVSGGRTGNALNDYNAAKTIIIPDWRDYALAALGDMGNADAGRLTAGFWGGNPLQLGAVGGKESGALTAVNQLPSHQHGVFLKDQHTHPFTAVLTVSAQNAAGSPAFNIPNTPTSGTTGQNAAGSITVGSVNGVANDNLTAAQGQATPAAFAAIGPRKLCTFYMKL